jgi:GTP1/Obg family GTP-binding protein
MIQKEARKMKNWPDEYVNIVRAVVDSDEFQTKVNQRQKLIQSIDQLSEKYENQDIRISEFKNQLDVSNLNSNMRMKLFQPFLGDRAI